MEDPEGNCNRLAREMWKSSRRAAAQNPRDLMWVAGNAAPVTDTCQDCMPSPSLHRDSLQQLLAVIMCVDVAHCNVVQFHRLLHQYH